MENTLKGTRIEYHILQSFPVTCLNRDEVGSPKSAYIGGVQRGRVSSQCWKRQVRMAMKDRGVNMAVRTKDIKQMINNACVAAGASEMQAQECAAQAAAALTDNTLFFFSASEADAIAEFAKENNFVPAALVTGGAKKDGDSKGKPKKAALAPELKKLLKVRLNPAQDGLDIALFGRMAAQAPEMNMQAAASFAHAITTHECANEIDFFTALDDFQNDEPGSAHMGTLEFNSGTYYRYISLDLGQLSENLNGHDLGEAVKNFTLALYQAVPSARQTTQTGMNPWDFARVLVRKGQGMQASFDEAVRSRDGYLKPSVAALNDRIQKNEQLAGSLYGKLGDYAIGVTECPKDAKECLSIDELAEALAAHAEKGGVK